MSSTRSHSGRLKLSKNLLEMKFMQRSKTRAESEKLEDERKVLFDVEVSDSMKKSGSKYIIEPSFVSCEDLVWGRMSFRGANVEVERIMKQIEGEKREKKIDDIETKGTVSAEEMANRYTTLIGTVAKKFTTNKKRSNPPDSATKSPHKRFKFMKPKD